MAANEHKNLSSANRHNPKAFETAINDTVLSKTVGTSATGTDGSLEWKGKSFMGVTNYKMQGYATGAANYFYGEDIADANAPYEMALDYGNSAVSAGNLSVSNLFRIGQGVIVPEAATVTSVKGWITSSGSNGVVVAICKATPTANDSSAVVPVVVDEITVTGLSSNDKMVAISETTISTAAIAAGDIIFPMIKESGGTGSTIYMNLTIQTTTF
mgnify:CR=1 FL=1|tara:strand:+ start:905 stop:1546 length:642 start_codon:yes stop_codon:yes gene_type:complete